MSEVAISAVAVRHLLPERRFAGPMPWIIAIMMMLTVLAAAAGLGLGAAAGALRAELAGRVTAQIVEANPDRRAAQARAAADGLRAAPGVRAVRIVDDKEIARLLAPWFGAEGVGPDLPVPALIDADLEDVSDRGIAPVAAMLKRVAPSARIDRHVAWLAPISSLLASLGWLAAAIMLLVTAATAGAVVLATHAALDTHGETIDILHLLGATDRQIARLFQQRIAFDALFGGLAGSAAALVVLLLVGSRIGAVGSDLLASARLPWPAWVLLAMLPLAGGLLAMATARLTILRVLRKSL